ncbi:MAG TPA: sigma factor-like helix-turn-helix DNA-binding protein [Acidimicrobiia bacterium]
MSDDRAETFESFFETAEPRLRRALVAAYGLERGREAAAEALAYGWERWDKVRGMRNPLGYLYRVGQSRTRARKHPPVFDVPAQAGDIWFEPGLANALSELSERQRLAVMLVHGFGWQLAEVAEVTGIRVPTVQTHAERGLARLRRALEVRDHV